ncbi:methyl-accepting chemotaxis protein [Tissierella sp. MB52-C2]|uniref:methyl-accepting chemotaxis protein n=1 Tax=Tissierella sp. MB52-C2 TaxID=3070999 RepID=UPI00280A56E4|nr:methyl-accepting chemotaxis protein [Tissierella sp. MB52-C2]WMM25353.1 methyl-accepting chemotaxis protein [Tissierella sp. MB52-C2]
MGKRIRDFLKLFIFSTIFMVASYFTSLYFESQIMQIVLTVLFSLGLSLVLLKVKGNGGMKEIINHLSNINNLDFDLTENIDISHEAREKIHQVYRQVRDNLKTQVEISTEIFNICEDLTTLAVESLGSAELIATSVEIADSNAVEQSQMLNETNNLADKIHLSMKNIDNDVIDKIQFISSSITTAQEGIEEITAIEDRIINSKSMLENNAKKVVELRNYLDEVVNLVDLINKISNQTKMLSLNASIEAARAGEEGKGFSVVANEVGKLANETETVSKKIEEVIHRLKDDIVFISNSMESEMDYMDENCGVMEKTNQEFIGIIETLNLGKESLEGIKESTGENNSMIEEIVTNVTRIHEFSEETTAQIVQTTEETISQHNRSKNLNDVVEKIKTYVYAMQQFVVGRVMEEKMVKQAHKVKEYFLSNKNINDNMIKELMKDTGVDAIYITDSKGAVEYTNEKSAIGLNLYEADPSFNEFKRGNKEYIVTPIKKRVEDGKLFKFLTLTDEKGRLYEIGLALDSLIKTIK